MKALLVASLIILLVTFCGCKEKPTTEELLLTYESALSQVADAALQSTQDAEAQASRGEMSIDQLEARYQEVTISWAITIEEIDREKRFRELWPLIFGGNEPPSLAKQPVNPDLLQWQSYIGQVEEYIFMHYQLVDAAWRKLGYS